MTKTDGVTSAVLICGGSRPALAVYTVCVNDMEMVIYMFIHIVKIGVYT